MPDRYEIAHDTRMDYIQKRADALARDEFFQENQDHGPDVDMEELFQEWKRTHPADMREFFDLAREHIADESDPRRMW